MSFLLLFSFLFPFPAPCNLSPSISSTFLSSYASFHTPIYLISSFSPLLHLFFFISSLFSVLLHTLNFLIFFFPQSFSYLFSTYVAFLPSFLISSSLSHYSPSFLFTTSPSPTHPPIHPSIHPSPLNILLPSSFPLFLPLILLSFSFSVLLFILSLLSLYLSSSFHLYVLFFQSNPSHPIPLHSI